MLPASYHTGFSPRDGYPAYPELWRGCVGAWAPCLGPTGLTLRDWSGRQNHGTLTNMVPGDDWVVSGGRYALDFDGSNDFVIANRPTFPIATTFSCWAKPTTGALSGLMSTRDTVSLLGVDFYLNSNGTVVFYCPSDNAGSNRSFFTTTNAVASGQWVHLAGRWQSSTLNDVWVNGIQAAGTLTGTVQATLTPRNNLRFGCLGVLSFSTGCMDDLRVYDRLLQPAEIRLLATRRGIAYEMYRPTYYAPQVTSARRRKILTGQV